MVANLAKMAINYAEEVAPFVDEFYTTVVGPVTRFSPVYGPGGLTDPLHGHDCTWHRSDLVRLR